MIQKEILSEPNLPGYITPARVVQVHAPVQHPYPKPAGNMELGDHNTNRLKDFLPSRSDLVPGKDWEIGEN